MKSALRFLTQRRCYARGSRLQPPPSARPVAEAPKESASELKIQQLFDSDPNDRQRNRRWRDREEAEETPASASVLLFPGQGTQFVGMGRNLIDYPNVRQMYALASSILGYDLLKLCLNGPRDMLDQTLFCQPAVLVTSLAALEKLRVVDPKAVESCSAAAGFSVGEVTALTFAGAFSFENAVRLIKIRAEAMHLASEVTRSGMMTVFFGPESNIKGACALAKEHCSKLGLPAYDCRVANYLYPDCKVVAGNVEALDFIQKHAADFKLRRLKRLPVSGAFHTDLMAPAVDVVKKALRRKIAVSDPLVRVHSNVDGRSYAGGGHVQRQLPQQIAKPVRWEQTMHLVYGRQQGRDFPRTFECGPGTSLKTVLRMVNAKAAVSCSSIEV